MDGSFMICGALIDVSRFETYANNNRRDLVGTRAKYPTFGLPLPSFAVRLAQQACAALAGSNG
jgi:hypothetical protein